MRFLERLQKLPEGQRKIILWSAVILIGILFFAFYIKNVQRALGNLAGEKIREQLRIPEFQEKIKEIPEVKIPELEIPEISEEELKKLEEEIKKAQEYGE